MEYHLNQSEPLTTTVLIVMAFVVLYHSQIATHKIETLRPMIKRGPQLLLTCTRTHDQEPTICAPLEATCIERSALNTRCIN